MKFVNPRNLEHLKFWNLGTLEPGNFETLILAIFTYSLSHAPGAVSPNCSWTQWLMDSGNYRILLVYEHASLTPDNTLDLNFEHIARWCGWSGVFVLWFVGIFWCFGVWGPSNPLRTAISCCAAQSLPQTDGYIVAQTTHTIPRPPQHDFPKFTNTSNALARQLPHDLFVASAMRFFEEDDSSGWITLKWIIWIKKWISTFIQIHR